MTKTMKLLGWLYCIEGICILLTASFLSMLHSGLHISEMTGMINLFMLASSIDVFVYKMRYWMFTLIVTAASFILSALLIIANADNRLTNVWFGSLICSPGVRKIAAFIGLIQFGFLSIALICHTRQNELPQ